MGLPRRLSTAHLAAARGDGGGSRQTGRTARGRGGRRSPPGAGPGPAGAEGDPPAPRDPPFRPRAAPQPTTGSQAGSPLPRVCTRIIGLLSPSLESKEREARKESCPSLPAAVPGARPGVDFWSLIHKQGFYLSPLPPGPAPSLLLGQASPSWQVYPTAGGRGWGNEEGRGLPRGSGFWSLVAYTCPSPIFILSAFIWHLLVPKYSSGLGKAQPAMPFWGHKLGLERDNEPSTEWHCVCSGKLIVLGVMLRGY